MAGGAIKKDSSGKGLYVDSTALGKVPSAGTADTATNAQMANAANSATTASTATNWTRKVIAGTALTGGGQLNQDRTLSVKADGNTLTSAVVLELTLLTRHSA